MNAPVARAIAELEDRIRSLDDALAIPREAGEFIHALVLATEAKRALEIGTSYGYSGLWIASALAQNGGRMITIDHDPRKSRAAREAFQAAGLLAAVEVRTGTATEVLAGLDGSFDFVLNDADKGNCIRYVELLIGSLSDRAVVLTDNTRTHPDELQPFVRWIRGRPDFFSCEASIGNGMELSVKQSGGGPVS